MVEGQLWMEPKRQWSANQINYALDLVVGKAQRADRTLYGFRYGTLIEWERLKTDEQTRRRIHGRVPDPLRGSEVSYVKPFAEDFESATRSLGSLKIAPAGEGMVRLLARSKSSGQVSDWVAEPTASKWLMPLDPELVEWFEEAGSSMEFDCFSCGNRAP